jgi:hypothetical protein
MTAVQLSFEQIAEQVAALPDDGRVHVDPRFGHIRVGEVIFADLHSVLNVWTYGGCDLTATDAQALGSALIAWADRHMTAGGRVNAPYSAKDGHDLALRERASRTCAAAPTQRLGAASLGRDGAAGAATDLPTPTKEPAP